MYMVCYMYVHVQYDVLQGFLCYFSGYFTCFSCKKHGTLSSLLENWNELSKGPKYELSLFIVQLNKLLFHILIAFVTSFLIGLHLFEPFILYYLAWCHDIMNGNCSAFHDWYNPKHYELIIYIWTMTLWNFIIRNGSNFSINWFGPVFTYSRI